MKGMKENWRPGRPDGRPAGVAGSRSFMHLQPFILLHVVLSVQRVIRRPGSAPVVFPWSTTDTPFTNT